MDRRRIVLALSALGASCIYGAARAQTGAKRLGVLIPFAESDGQAKGQVDAFRAELQKLGWNSDTLRVDYRWESGGVNRIRAAAKELAASTPDVIFARTTPVTRALLEQTRTIPIVFAVVSDPLGDGFVANLARPGGNVTGFTNVESTLGGKWIELLREINPDISTVAVMFGPKTAPGGGTYYLRAVEAAGRSVSLKVISHPVNEPGEITQAVAGLAKQRNVGLLITPDVTTATNRTLITALANRHRVIAMYSASYFVEEGGLVSYGIDYVDLYRRAAGYVDRILRGAKPGDLPIQGPTKFELVVNARTAKDLGVAMPRALLLRADKVIE